jgi:WD40 repeat protein
MMRPNLCVVAAAACGLVLAAASAAAAQTAPFVPTRDAQCVALSADGKLAATGKSGLSNEEASPRPHPTPSKAGVIQVWDVATGKMLRRMETFGDLTKVAFSPDGSVLATSRLFSPGEKRQMNEVCLWNVTTGRLLHAFNGCHAFAWSPDGGRLAVLSRSRCVLYDPATRKKTGEVKPLGRSLAVAYSPDGTRLAGVLRNDAGSFVLRVCRAEDAAVLAESPPMEQPFYAIAYSPDGNHVASGHGGGFVLVWDTAVAMGDRLSLAARFNAENGGLQYPFYSPDGTVLGSGTQDNGDVVFWDVASGNELRRYTHQRGSFRTYYPRTADDQVQPEKSPSRFAFSPDGEAFIAGCYGGIIRLLSSGQDIRRFDD